MDDSPLIFQFTDQKSPLLRDARGRYISAQHRLADANRNAADQTQRLLLKHIAKVKRPGVSSDRLLTVSAGSGNRRSQPGGYTQGWELGIPDYLNNSVAKYWRQIELGSEVTWQKRPFIGLQVKGLFGESIAGVGQGKSGSRVFAGAPWTQPGKGTGGKIVPWGAIKGQNIRSEGGKRLKPGLMVVKHDFEGQHAYAAAWRDYGAGRRVRRDLQALLASLSGRGEWL